MTDKAKAPYVNKSKLDQKRHEKETKDYETKGFFINSDGENSKDLYQIKYGVQPKRAMSAYFIFMNEYRRALMTKDPSLKITEITKMATKAWANLSEDQKGPFIKKHNEDLERCQTEKKQLNENGFFVNSAGIKSTEMKQKKKRNLADKRRSSESNSNKKTNRSKSLEAKSKRAA